MSKVIDFKTPAQLREEIIQKDEEIHQLKAQLSNISAVKEMLTLSALDLQEQVAGLIKQMSLVQQNVENLINRLSN